MSNHSINKIHNNNDLLELLNTLHENRAETNEIYSSLYFKFLENKWDISFYKVKNIKAIEEINKSYLDLKKLLKSHLEAINARNNE